MSRGAELPGLTARTRELEQCWLGVAAEQRSRAACHPAAPAAVPLVDGHLIALSIAATNASISTLVRRSVSATRRASSVPSA